MNNNEISATYTKGDLFIDAVGLISDDLLAEYEAAEVKPSKKATLLSKLFSPTVIKTGAIAAGLILVIGASVILSEIITGVTQAPKEEAPMGTMHTPADKEQYPSPPAEAETNVPSADPETEAIGEADSAYDSDTESQSDTEIQTDTDTPVTDGQ